jgi:hypothetical protein
VLVAGDVLRAAAALSVVVGLVGYTWLAGALFFPRARQASAE